MENASKALLMAGAVLLGIMVLSLGVLLFSSFGGTSSRIHDNIEENQATQFNSQFTKYVGKENVTIYDVVSMARLATQNNQNYEFAHRTVAGVTGVDRYISVICGNVSIELGYLETQTVEDVESHFNKLISEDLKLVGQNGLPKYNVTVEISEVTNRVFKVICVK